MTLLQTAAAIWRRYATDGVPASGVNQPDKQSIIAWGTFLESMTNLGAGFAYPSAAAINADLAHPANTLAIVYADATPANNGMYIKVGASGAGGWSRVADLPTSLVRLTVTGGTGDAIVATGSETPQMPGSKLFLMTPTAANTTTTHIVVDGGASIEIKNAFGLSLAANSLLNGSQVLMAWQTDHYQLLLSANPDASAFTAACAASATAAAASATAAASSASALGNQVAQYDTRALAITATIPAGVNFVRTLAYDSSFLSSSGAKFARVASGTPFVDTWPLTGTIAGGSLYTNGTYYGVGLSGGSGSGISATVTISGGAVTAVSYATQPGNGYKVGDVLTVSNAQVGGTGSGFTYTIATISTPTASFTNTHDSSLWQYLPEGFTHVNQFGAKPDWSGTDAGATNNFTAFQNALFFGGRHSLPEGLGALGDRVLCGYGIYLLTSSPAASLIVPFGVFLEGVGGTNLKFGDVFDANTHCVTLGDPNSRQACFRSGLRYLTLTFPRGIAVSSSIAMVYSNSTQDGGGLDTVYIYAGRRCGVSFEIGYGGASTVYLDTVSISYEGANPAVVFNYGTTVVDVRDLIIGAPSSGFNATVDSVVLNGSGGMYKFDGGHTELVPNGFLVNLTSSAQVTIKNWTGGNGCTQLVTLAIANTPGNLSLEQCAKNGATRLVTNGQPSGSNRAGDVQPKDGIVFFNP